MRGSWRLSVAAAIDLTDAEGEQVKPLLPKSPRCGRTPGVDLREVLNAIRYMARSGERSFGWLAIGAVYCVTAPVALTLP